MTRTPVCIVTGYLGAGKTTLLQHVLANADRKVAVMNEFGDVNIDADILHGENVDIAELDGGCVCCSLTGEFENAAREIKDRYAPDLIIVETTGVAEPDTLIDNVDDLDGFTRDAVVCVVDGHATAQYADFGHTGKVQVQEADIVVLNKTDRITDEEISEVEHRIRKVNDHAPILPATQGRVDLHLLLGFGVSPRPERESIPHEHSHEFVRVQVGPVNKESFEAFAETLSEAVYRAKGFITTDTRETFLFQYVFDQYTLEPVDREERGTDLVFIGNLDGEEHGLKNAVQGVTV